MSEIATIQVTGLNGASEITVERVEERTLADVLTDNGINLDSGLNVKVNGQRVDPHEVSVTEVNTGDQVLTTPSNVKLGA